MVSHMVEEISSFFFFLMRVDVDLTLTSDRPWNIYIYKRKKKNCFPPDKIA